MKKLLSIILATRNRADSLAQALESLIRQNTGGIFDYEIILIDNNSTDATKDIVAGLSPKFSFPLKYIFEPTKGKVFALNKGIQSARGEILVFTDDDIHADPQWLAKIYQCFETSNADGVGGRVLPVYPPHTPKWIKDNIKILSGPIVNYDYGEETKELKKPMYEFLGANMAIKKKAMEDIGLFRTNLGPGLGTMGEDTEFISRLVAAGKKLIYCGSAVVWHPVDAERMNLRYIRQWNITLGRYRTFSMQDTVIMDKNLVYMFGVPRYLLGRILKTTLQFPIFIFNRKKFLEKWIESSIDLGRAAECRKIYLKQT